MTIEEKLQWYNDVLKLSGKLSIAVKMVLQSSARDLSLNLNYMEKCLEEYDNAIIEEVKNRDK